MTMITPSYLGETIEYSSLHACRSTLEDPMSSDMEEVMAISDRIMVMNSGRVQGIHDAGTVSEHEIVAHVGGE